MQPEPFADVNAPKSGLPVDGHVHFHRLDRVGETLDFAAANFSQVGCGGTNLQGVLMLVESHAEDVFGQLADVGVAGDWCISAVEREPQSLLASSCGRTLLIICGRQIRCADGLEVLALGALQRYPQGADIERTLARVQADGHLAVVPWGFLKWRGARGDRIRDIIAGRPRGSLFFGDNGGRIEALGPPRLLQQAEQAGFALLPGTDPFPFGHDYRRVGSFGFVARAELDPAAPWTTLQHWLRERPDRVRPYGRALGPLKFVFNQGWIQVHNKMLRRRAA